MGLANLFGNFTRWGGVHGIAQSGRVIPQHIALRILFIITFFLAFTGYLIQLTFLVKQFNDREVSTTVQMQFKTLIFPSVTVCNTNPYKKSSIFNSRELTELMSGYNFVSQLQSMNDGALSSKRKKRESSEDCVTITQQSIYANHWSNNLSVDTYLSSCPLSSGHLDQYCMSGCGSDGIHMCVPVINASCTVASLVQATSDIDRIFRNCVETGLCFEDNFCNNHSNPEECITKLSSCASEGSSDGLCLDPVVYVCRMINNFCDIGRECLNFTINDFVINNETNESNSGHDDTTSPPAANENIYAPKAPPPPPGVLPPKPPPNPPAPPGYPPASLDPWVPPPPPPSIFVDTSLPPPPPLDFSVIGLLSSNSSDAIALVAQLSNIAGDLNISESATAAQVFLDVQMQLIEVASQLSSEERKLLGYTREELITSCSFNGVPCDIKNDFLVFEDPDYGNCYTYNYNSKRISHRPGNTYGLTLTVMTNVTEYLFTTQQSGARITIHAPGTVPFPAISGYSVSSGTSTSFKIRYSEFERIEHPYGNCTNEKYSNYYFDGNYTYEGCFRSCFQDYVTKMCGCGDPRLPLPPQKARADFHMNQCRRTNETENGCINYIYKNKMEEAHAGCLCYLPCWQQTYTIQPGISVWPSNPNFSAGLCFPTVLKEAQMTCQELYQKNALTVDVFYDYFNYEVIVETPVMTKENLWNQASGAIGLWTSLSFISALEIMATLSQCVLFICGWGRLPHPIPNVEEYTSKRSITNIFPCPSYNTMGLSNLFVNFTRWCGIHGLSTSGYIKPQHRGLRTLFVIAFICAFLGYCTQLVLLMKQFQSREVSTTVHMKFKPLIFPSVTICNLNPYKKTSIFNSRQLTELMAGYNFASQMQSLNAAPSKRKKRLASGECISDTHPSIYANDWSNEESVQSILKYCPTTSRDAQFCMTGCGSNEMYLCLTPIESRCSEVELAEATTDIDRIFRKCVETELCFEDNFCDINHDPTQCMSNLGSCASEGQPIGLCLDSLVHVCEMINEFCQTDEQECILSQNDIDQSTTTLSSYQQITTTPEPIEVNIYAPPPPPPPPGVLPPKPPPNAPAPPGYPPASLDPWVPPAPPPSKFDDPTLPPPPPQEFSLIGLLHSNSSDARALVAQLSNIANDLNIDPTSSTGKIFVDVQMQMVEVASELTSEEKGLLGYSRKELLSSCSFDGEACDLENDFTLFEDPDYGNCYTYNYHSHIISGRSGNTHGLRLTIVTNVSEYLFTTQQSGARITIHPPGTVPFPAIKGYSVSAGSSTSFKVRYSEIELLEAPYGNCTRENVGSYYFDGNYTYEGCFRSCLQDFVGKYCKCGDSRYPMPLPNARAKTLSPCRRTNNTESECLEDVYKNKMKEASESCPCSDPCWHEAYNVQPGISVWPSNPNFVAGLCFPSVLKKSKSTCQNFYQKNALTVSVYYDYFNYEIIVETPVMSSGTLWNQASGAIGLWTSLSFISILEILAAIFQCLLFICGRGKLPYPIPDTDSQTSAYKN